jgi:hypothetical protein
MVTQFERDYGHDPALAERMVHDFFKAPEQRIEAQEFLDSLNSGEDKIGDPSDQK